MEDDPQEKSVSSKFPQAVFDVQVFINTLILSQISALFCRAYFISNKHIPVVKVAKCQFMIICYLFAGLALQGIGY